MLLVDDVMCFVVGVFFCLNLLVGVFNVYVYVVVCDDIDFVLYFGDYFYEYKCGGYLVDSLCWDLVVLQIEVLLLVDYCLCYVSYWVDFDLQVIYNCYLMIVLLDDYELVNDSWEGGV